MADRGTVIISLLFLIGIGGLLIFAGPLIYETLTPHSYAINIVYVDEAEAKTGELIHLQEADVAATPRLLQALLAGSSGTIDLNMDQYDGYRAKYPNYSRNSTGSRVYYDYQGTYFYLGYTMDNRQHL